MTEADIYSTPEADLEVARSNQYAFFSTSILKLTVLYIVTFGLYPIYWFYKNWASYKEYTGIKLKPALRSIFYIIFTHSLFQKINEKAVNQGIETKWNAYVLATVFVLLTIVSSVLDTISRKTSSIGMADYISFALMFILMWPLITVQRTVNSVNNDPSGEINSSFSFYNYVFILLGVLVWILAVVGLSGIDISALG